MVTLVYDGDCRLCRFAARVVARLDGAGMVVLLPFADPAARTLLAQIPEPERLSSWHLVLPDGRRHSEGRGLVVLLESLPSTRRAARALRGLPLDALYRLVARNRGRLGRLVPDGPAPRTRMPGKQIPQ